MNLVNCEVRKRVGWNESQEIILQFTSVLRQDKKPWTNPGRHQRNTLVTIPVKEIPQYSYIRYFNVLVPSTLPVIKVGFFSHKTIIFGKYLADFFLSSFSADIAKMLNILFFLKIYRLYFLVMYPYMVHFHIKAKPVWRLPAAKMNHPTFFPIQPAPMWLWWTSSEDKMGKLSVL